MNTDSLSANAICKYNAGMENENEYATITFRLPPEEKEAFAQICKRKKWRQSAVLRMIMEEWVKKHEENRRTETAGSRISREDAAVDD